MAAELIWSSESLDDIDSIAQFIGRDSPHHAQRVVEGLFEMGETIITHPLAGGFYPVDADTSKKAHDGPKGVSCPSEEHSTRISSVRPSS